MTQVNNGLPFIHLAVALDNVRSRHNVGSIFRTADAAGVEHLYLTGYTPRPPHPRINKVSLGAERSVSWSHEAQLWRLIKKLKAAGVRILALENNVPGTQNLFSYKVRYPALLMVGGEVAGLSGAILKQADAILAIPMAGQKESLNVSVAFGIAAYYLKPISCIL